MGLDVHIGKRTWREPEEDDEQGRWIVANEINPSSPIRVMPEVADNWWYGSYVGTQEFFEETGLWDWIKSLGNQGNDYPSLDILSPDMLVLVRDARAKYQGPHDYYHKSLLWFEFWMYYAIGKYGSDAAIRLS